VIRLIGWYPSHVRLVNELDELISRPIVDPASWAFSPRNGVCGALGNRTVEKEMPVD